MYIYKIKKRKKHFFPFSKGILEAFIKKSFKVCIVKSGKTLSRHKHKNNPRKISEIISRKKSWQFPRRNSCKDSLFLNFTRDCVLINRTLYQYLSIIFMVTQNYSQFPLVSKKSTIRKHPPKTPTHPFIGERLIYMNCFFFVEGSERANVSIRRCGWQSSVVVNIAEFAATNREATILPRKG